MAETKVPYVTAYGTVPKALQQIVRAPVPDRFTQDFLAAKLGLKGGGAKAVIPFFKRVGLLGSDGTPTDLYSKFRNEKLRGGVAAEALRRGFSALYEINEYVHEVDDAELKGIVMQATGLGDDASQIKPIIGSFRALRDFAEFDGPDPAAVDLAEESVEDVSTADGEGYSLPTGLNLRYNINLHLPATSDIAVFNAIFKSLREHLLD